MIFCFNAGEVFEVAIRIEKNGIAFYERAQQAIDDPDVKALFSALAEDGQKHKKQFEDFKAGLPQELKAPTVQDPDNQLDQYIEVLADNHVFSSDRSLEDELATVKTVSDALDMAMRFEKDSVIFYLSMKEATCEGRAFELIDALIKEKQHHVQRLSVQTKKCSADVKECLLNWPS